MEGLQNFESGTTTQWVTRRKTITLFAHRWEIDSGSLPAPFAADLATKWRAVGQKRRAFDREICATT